MLEQIAKKKGLVEYKDVTTDKIENVNTTKSGKKARVARNVVEKQMVCNVDEAAKRMIRDFLNNRLNHYVVVINGPRITYEQDVWVVRTC